MIKYYLNLNKAANPIVTREFKPLVQYDKQNQLEMLYRRGFIFYFKMWTC